MDWSKFTSSGVTSSGDVHTTGTLPPVPDESLECGVLPRVIQNLVQRRRKVKRLMTSEANAEKKQELDIRQKALKLTANSMYGCLGFSNSRFYAQPIAAMVTALGRETLQRTVDIATNTMGLDVIYGDTDSIMINTRISDPKDYGKALELGNKVKDEVNRLYKLMELEIDGTFRSMLLLKKKKYAATTVERGNDGKLVYGKEMKGLDLVRRDWCIQSKDTGRYVLNQILSGEDREEVITRIHDHLENLAKTMREGKLPLEKYVITKGLSKHPNDYPDAKSQPHVLVAKAMLKNNQPVHTGDHIPYVICLPLEDDTEKPPPAVERGRHPDEIRRSNGALKPDVEWYLTQQILPPTSRLCEPIDGTSSRELAERLGLDSSKYNLKSEGGNEIDDENLVDFTPATSLSDEERFKNVDKLILCCESCGVENAFPGVFVVGHDKEVTSGLQCVNPTCPRPAFWGCGSHLEVLALLSNTAAKLVHRCMQTYYSGVAYCDDPSCSLKDGTRQLSVMGDACFTQGCTGTLRPKYSERSLHTQLTYLNSLFDVDHAAEQVSRKTQLSKQEILQRITRHDKNTMALLKQENDVHLQRSAFNWIEPSLWTSLFGAALKEQ
eukprot:CAMPEP_0116836160 /NCGR_PEP_ID=MMETSP0418-20121206/7940_1 /TAXON_ID=1158023 /ORGANISM="Astrosyne radiata, Strain 13vi08-1A" /LENGTH=608 /DNA_ID=CAMNT_0004465895 /DNA_START=30 /DNA_END=1856 /DNA_ORIENTATION=+